MRLGGTEAQLERQFHHFMPVHTAACDARLDQFFAQWFDTGYPAAAAPTGR